VRSVTKISIVEENKITILNKGDKMEMFDEEEKQQIKQVFKWVGLVVVVSALLAVSLRITHSYFEAKAFNRVTGQNVSTWDAYWLELRIDDKK